MDPTGINYLTDIYNLSLAGSEIPAVYKLVAIAAILNDQQATFRGHILSPDHTVFPLSQDPWPAPAGLPDWWPPRGPWMNLNMGSVLRSLPPLRSSLLHTGSFQGSTSANPSLEFWPLPSTFKSFWYAASWPSHRLYHCHRPQLQYQKVVVHLPKRPCCLLLLPPSTLWLPQPSHSALLFSPAFLTPSFPTTHTLPISSCPMRTTSPQFRRPLRSVRTQQPSPSTQTKSATGLWTSSSPTPSCFSLFLLQTPISPAWTWAGAYKADLILLCCRPRILGVTVDSYFTFRPQIANVFCCLRQIPSGMFLRP